MDPKRNEAPQSRERLRCALPARMWLWRAGGRLLAAREDPPTLTRWGLHATVVGLAVLAAVAGPRSARPFPSGGAHGLQPPAADGASLLRQTSSRSMPGYLVRAAQPRTALSERPIPEPPAQNAQRSTQTYVVQQGDTVFDLARRFGVTPDTILSANPSLAGNPDLLKLGQQLTILPVSGVLYEVRPGDTLASIAREYKIDEAAIVAYPENQLSEPYALQVGQKLLLPGARLPAPAGPRYAAAGSSDGRSAVAATGAFMWPTTGRLTQYPWWGHMAIDIGAATGTPIYAADAGYVSQAGWTNSGYGLYVVLDHGNGFRTLYGHMSVVIARVGQTVEKGALIGRVGSTGNSTGPHLHFEVYKGGVLQNPLAYLP